MEKNKGKEIENMLEKYEGKTMKSQEFIKELKQMTPSAIDLQVLELGFIGGEKDLIKTLLVFIFDSLQLGHEADFL